jgi:hypothetical protein
LFNFNKIKIDTHLLIDDEKKVEQRSRRSTSSSSSSRGLPEGKMFFSTLRGSIYTDKIADHSNVFALVLACSNLLVAMLI